MATLLQNALKQDQQAIIYCLIIYVLNSYRMTKTGRHSSEKEGFVWRNMPLYLVPRSSSARHLLGKWCLHYSLITTPHCLLISSITITEEWYCKTLERLQCAIKAKCLGKLRNRVILLHDNTRPDIVNAKTQKWHSLKGLVLEHLPNSPDFSMWFSRFWSFEKFLKGRWFLLDVEMQ